MYIDTKIRLPIHKLDYQYTNFALGEKMRKLLPGVILAASLTCTTIGATTSFANTEALTDTTITNNEIINIKDEKLLACINKHLDPSKDPIAPITVEESKTIKELNCYNLGIEYVDGLEHFINLESLNLNLNKISNISSLGTSTNYLNHNKINKSNNIKSLQNLFYLYLDSNQIEDINSIAELTNLKFLSLANNKVKNISMLKTLSNNENLEHFYIDQQKIVLPDLIVGEEQRSPVTNLSGDPQAINTNIIEDNEKLSCTFGRLVNCLIWKFNQENTLFFTWEDRSSEKITFSGQFQQKATLENK